MKSNNFPTTPTTINYYNTFATDFVSSTAQVDFHSTQDRFLSFLKPGALILDFGCGSGRDTKYFLGKGYEVEAIDGSAKLCELASEFTGIKVKEMLFEELDDIEKYDGIWACASILHLSKKSLPEIIIKMKNAIKVGGYIYTSFKLGDFEGEINGRYFTFLDIDSFKELIKGIDDIIIEESFISEDARKGREEEIWLNLIIKRI